MRYWDSSAIVPLVVVEPSSEVMEHLLEEDGRIATWWWTPVECASAVARRGRDGSLEAAEVGLAARKLAVLERRWEEALPTASLRESARRAVRVHDLRAADAFQLAAAMDAGGGDPAGFPFVTLDQRLALAASREGFSVEPA